MSTGTAPCTPLGFTHAAAAQTSWTQTRARSLSSFSAGIAGKSMPRVLLMPPLIKHASEVPTRSTGQLVTPMDVVLDEDGGNRIVTFLLKKELRGGEITRWPQG